MAIFLRAVSPPLQRAPLRPTPRSQVSQLSLQRLSSQVHGRRSGSGVLKQTTHRRSRASK
jgi:hypothetical protein